MKRYVIFTMGLMLTLGGGFSARAAAQTTEAQSLNEQVSTPRNGWPKADKKFYFDFYGGYACRMGGGYTGFMEYIEWYQGPLGAFSRPREIKRTLGTGWRGGLNFGYHFNRYMAVEVGLGYVKSAFSASRFFYCDTSGLVYLKDVYPYIEMEPEPFSYIAFSDHFSGHVGNLQVALRISPGFKRWDPYLRMGVNLMVGVIDHQVNINLGPILNPIEDPYNGNAFLNGATDEAWGNYGRSGHERLVTTSVGFTAAFGVTCRFTPTVSMFAEWQFTLMSSVSYRDHWIEAGNAWGNEEYSHVLDKAVGSAIRSDFVLPFSNTGLNIGLKFAF